jgi:hypothetical protein
MTKILPNILIIFTCCYYSSLNFYCRQPVAIKDNPKDSIGEFASAETTIKNGNITTTLSSDSAKLAKILNFKRYKPYRVKFQYTFIDNSGGGKRLSVPGPSDFKLEAILYFDAATFASIMDSYSQADWNAPNYNKEEFNFNWLEAAEKTALLKSDSSYHGHIDLFFTEPNDPNSHTWILNKKILLHRFSQ